MRSALSLLMLAPLLQGCLWQTQPGERCDYSGREKDRLAAVQLAVQRWQMPPAAGLALLEPKGPPWVRPRPLDWDEYRMQNENWSASVDQLEDAADFIGWFGQRGKQRLQLDWRRVSDHYLAIRLGHGDYFRRIKGQHPQLEQQAEQAALRAEQWQSRLRRCPPTVAGQRWWRVW